MKQIFLLLTIIVFACNNRGKAGDGGDDSTTTESVAPNETKVIVDSTGNHLPLPDTTKNNNPDSFEHLLKHEPGL